MSPAGSVAAADNGAAVATGSPGTTAFEFVCRITQNGFDFHGLGYLTQVTGLDAADLFADPQQRDEAHALIVATATGTLVARSVDDIDPSTPVGAVHSLDIDGALSVYLREGAGASFTDAGSFTTNRPLGLFALELQDVLTIIAPQTGLPVLNGSAHQTDVGTIGGRRFGRHGQDLRFVATGFGTRSDNNTSSPQATLSVAGELIVA